MLTMVAGALSSSYSRAQGLKVCLGSGAEEGGRFPHHLVQWHPLPYFSFVAPPGASSSWWSGPKGSYSLKISPPTPRLELLFTALPLGSDSLGLCSIWRVGGGLQPAACRLSGGVCISSPLSGTI